MVGDAALNHGDSPLEGLPPLTSGDTPLAEAHIALVIIIAGRLGRGATAARGMTIWVMSQHDRRHICLADPARDSVRTLSLERLQMLFSMS